MLLNIFNFCLSYLKQFVIFKPPSYCFEETKGFDVKTSFTSRPASPLIRWCNKPGDITKEFWEKAVQFHGTFHGLKITNWKDFEFDIKHAVKNDYLLFWKYIIWERSSSFFCKTISHVLPQRRQSSNETQGKYFLDNVHSSKCIAIKKSLQN